MFVSQLCGAAVPPRTPAARVIVRRRPKQYPYRPNANVLWRLDATGKRKQRVAPDPGGEGWEIDREALACPPCAAARAPDD
jgi:hypothetical protein